MIWSSYQESIFRFVQNDTRNGMINAVAGSGKSQTGEELCSIFPKHMQGKFMAFGKAIADELSARMKNRGLSNVEGMTYNRFGNQIIARNNHNRPELDKNKTENILRYDIFDGITNQQTERQFYKFRGPLVRLISLFKNMNLHHLDAVNQNYDTVVEHYDIEIPDDKLFKTVVMDVFQKSITITNYIDFDDQKFFPLLFGMDIPQSDFLVLDEAQDTCPVEMELLLRSCRDGRIFFLGDPWQAIYSFKGTVPDAMTIMQKRLEAVELPLSICYRCPKASVELAKTIVSHIEAAPGAIEGCVDTVEKDQYYKAVTNRDMILARCTNDLVSSCLSLIREGRAAYVDGKEIGQSIIYLIDKVAPYDGMTIEVFNGALRDYKSQKLEYFKKAGKDESASNLEDKCDTIDAVSEGCMTVKDIKNRIDSIFSTVENGVRHMTIHKSKGLQSEKDGNVYLLRPDKIPHKRAKKEHQLLEENRLLYVAYTRPRAGFFFVNKGRDER